LKLDMAFGGSLRQLRTPLTLTLIAALSFVILRNLLADQAALNNMDPSKSAADHPRVVSIPNNLAVLQ
jgi:hypothetical protein